MANTKQKRKWWPNCSVCQYMRRNPDFREAVMKSSYIDPEGQESLLSVNAKFGSVFKSATLYKHMRMHQAEDIERGEEAARLFSIPNPNWQRHTSNSNSPTVIPNEPTEVRELLDSTEKAVEGDVIPRMQHEVALDDFIKLGREKVRKGEMLISAANYIAAIKVKTDIERSTKDRRLEMLKTMFAGAAPKGTPDAAQSQ